MVKWKNLNNIYVTNISMLEPSIEYHHQYKSLYCSRKVRNFRYKQRYNFRRLQWSRTTAQHVRYLESVLSSFLELLKYLFLLFI